MFDYHASLVKVIDGDTLDVVADLGFHINVTLRLRIKGINAPETSTVAGVAAREWARSILPLGSFLTISTEKDPGDKYGRWLAKVTMPDGSDYATTAIDTGHAVAWDGPGPRPTQGAS